METLEGKKRYRIDAKLPDEAGDRGRFPSNLSTRKVTGRFISQDRKNRNSFPAIAIALGFTNGLATEKREEQRGKKRTPSHQNTFEAEPTFE